MILCAFLIVSVFAGNPCMCKPVDEKAHFAQTQNEMNQDAEDNFKKADAELNKTYKQLISKLKGTEKKALIDSELAWIKFRDTNCAFWASPNKGGSIYPLIYFGKKKKMTESRTAELKNALKEFYGN